MTSREVATPRLISFKKGSIATVTSLNLDQKLAVGANYKPGDRVAIAISGTTAGTTDTTTYKVQDAPDNSGSIGTPADVTVVGTLASGTSDQCSLVSYDIQPGRPWVRVVATRASGTTDTVVVGATFMAVPHGI